MPDFRWSCGVIFTIFGFAVSLSKVETVQFSIPSVIEAELPISSIYVYNDQNKSPT